MLNVPHSWVKVSHAELLAGWEQEGPLWNGKHMHCKNVQFIWNPSHYIIIEICDRLHLLVYKDCWRGFVYNGLPTAVSSIMQLYTWSVFTVFEVTISLVGLVNLIDKIVGLPVVWITTLNLHMSKNSLSNNICYITNCMVSTYFQFLKLIL